MNDHIVSQSHIFYTEVLPSNLLDLMEEEIRKLQNTNFASGPIGDTANNVVINPSIRNSQVSFTSEDNWMVSILEHYFKISNKKNWEYDLDYLDLIQISRYSQGNHYSWHSDYGTSSNKKLTRKLSASLLMSDPNTYTGGDLELIDYHGNVITAPRKKGTLVVFDSRVPHRVTKIMSGERTSLVAWMLGPKLI